MMRIVTYNFAHRAREQWSKIFNDFDPDIVLAQEARHPQVDIPDFYRANEERFFWSPITGSWGNALFIKQGQITRLNLSEIGNWVTGVEITEFNWLQSSSRSLRIFNVHAPTKEGVHKVKEYLNDFLNKIVEFSSEGNLIIGGDFNLTVGIWHLNQRKDGNNKDSLRLLTRLRTEFGLMSSWQVANPNRNLPATLRLSNSKIKIFHCDGIFVPAAWYQFLKSCEVVSQGWETLSDHNPVVATFEMSKMENL